ncbi:MAG: efflux RND transporter periplasmic adaptor subunit [Armatimonadetes bacterium]|nr:efflux RND transporter periplasmic adaptor subunit [Armatimonadota bacterium]MDE2207435.1 efflux RND transporter periplasmic adaptor subunit [Armatimonadota bacterium]
MTVGNPTTDSQRPLSRPGRKVAAASGAVFVAVGLFTLLRMESTSAHAAPAVTAPVTTVITAAAAATWVPEYVTASGTVEAQQRADLSSRITSRVTAVMVHMGERVKRGELLMTLDGRDLTAAEAQATADVNTARAGLQMAHVRAAMEAATSVAGIADAAAHVNEAAAAMSAAEARLQRTTAGPRPQERAQAALAVNEAHASFALAQQNLMRMTQLHDEGAISDQTMDESRSQFQVAQARWQTAQQAQSLTAEGSRAEDVRAAQEAVAQAGAGLKSARAALQQSRAIAMQVQVRRQEVISARAQLAQSAASLNAAVVTSTYTRITAPFDGVVAQRMADPGAMAVPGVPLLTVQGGRLRLLVQAPERVLGRIAAGSLVPLSIGGGSWVMAPVAEIAPEGDNTSHTFAVKIDLPNSYDGAVGAFGRAKFVIGARREILVPQAAVMSRQGLRFVMVAAAGIVHLRLVETGERVGKLVAVSSGLNAGERVVAVPVEGLRDGAKVQQ